MPGAMFTASHNPAQYNGIKLCRAGAQPIGAETGLAEIRDAVERPASRAGGRAPGRRSPSATCSTTTPPTCSPSRRSTGRRLQGGRRRRQRHGRATPRRRCSTALGATVELVPMYFELDGTFPHHEANPIEPANLVDLQAAGRRGAAPTSASPSTATPTGASSSTSAAGRCRPSTLTALIAARELAKEPGRRGDPQPDHQPRRARAGHASSAARPVRTRVGHSYIKATMAETDAVFGGEHSGHFYFRDFWRADSGMLAALHALAALAETDRPLSELLADYERYVAQRRDQLRRSPTRPPWSPTIEAAYAGGDGVDARPPRRADRHHRRLVVQRPAVQHRAAAAPQRRGRATRPPWPGSATTSSP